MWNALMWSALEDQSEYATRMSNQIGKSSETGRKRQHRVKARSAPQKADVIRKLLTVNSKRQADSPAPATGSECGDCPPWR